MLVKLKGEITDANQKENHHVHQLNTISDYSVGHLIYELPTQRASWPKEEHDQEGKLFNFVHT